MDEKKGCEKCRKLNAVYERLQKNRELEIKNLWQRSIFLATFLVLCYTAYGTLIKDVLCSDCAIKDNVPCLNLVLIFISLVGILMSILWICMAKGSKAWQEVYEDAISDYEHRYWRDIPDEFHSDELKGDHNKRDRCLLSVNGGPYSPSKINIVIGQISFAIWIFIYFAHVICHLKISIELGKWGYCVPIAIASIVVGIVIWLMLRDPYKKNKENWLNVVSKHLLHPDNDDRK